MRADSLAPVWYPLNRSSTIQRSLAFHQVEILYGHCRVCPPTGPSVRSAYASALDLVTRQSPLVAGNHDHCWCDRQCGPGRRDSHSRRSSIQRHLG